MTDTPEATLERIRNDPDVVVEPVKTVVASCITCEKPLGYAVTQTIVPKGESYAFRARFACMECGPTAAILALAEMAGQA